MTRRELLVTGLVACLWLPGGCQRYQRFSQTGSPILQRTTTGKSKLIGARFTISHAMWLNGSWQGPLGNDQPVGPSWQASLREITNSGVSVIGLSHPWDQVEPDQGKFNWKELDEAVEICEQAGVEIVLCFGVKSPRHPEFHPPAWIKQEVEKTLKSKSRGDELQVELPEKFQKQLEQLRKQAKKDKKAKASLETIEAAIDQYREKLRIVVSATPKARAAIVHYIIEGVKRYRDRKSVVAWQIENEPLTFTRPMALSQVKDEIEHVRSLDAKNKRPILVTTWTAVDVEPAIAQGWSPAVRQIMPLGDIVGFDCYLKSHKFEAQPGHWALVKQWMDQARKQGKQVWITEWQAEPWEQDQKMDFKNPYGNASFNPRQYETSLTKAKQLGSEKIFLWGLEFQIACKHQGNDAWWKATQQIIANY